MAQTQIVSPVLDPKSPNLIPVSPTSVGRAISDRASAISLLSLNTDEKRTRRTSDDQPISPINLPPYMSARYQQARPIPIRTRIHPNSAGNSTPGSPHLSPVSAACTPTSLNLNKFALDR